MTSLLVVAILFLLTAFFLPSLFINGPTAAASNPGAAVLWEMDFSGVGENAREALADLGFSLEKDMADEDKIHLTGTGGGLEVSALQSTFGLMIKPGLDVDADQVEIEWGIDRYPAGADWERENYRQALMVYLFFGDKVGADRIYLPDSPHFIGLFLGENVRLHTPYLGLYYQETGRYVCLGDPEPGRMTLSRFDIGTAYREFFQVDTVPPVTGIGIEVDTNALADGTASAFIRRITLRGPATGGSG